MSAWRAAGLNYTRYSQISAQLLRQALKKEFKADAEKRGATHIKFTRWADGKPISERE
ncbi:protein stunted-like isoform X2 [Agrilus planipennis]|uniref:Protein stunted-like isoform X2 n=1 Tax=Agrilus planipennis TaxID=224129 RepID=A0A7F5R988_AGRPL|nr:protein stunted-like isoform X2 [Agrilus planipennis]